VKHAKDTFEQGDESTWYKEPPPENGEESDFAKKSSKPFEEFNQQVRVRARVRVRVRARRVRALG